MCGWTYYRGKGVAQRPGESFFIRYLVHRFRNHGGPNNAVRKKERKKKIPTEKDKIMAEIVFLKIPWWEVAATIRADDYLIQIFRLLSW